MIISFITKSQSKNLFRGKKKLKSLRLKNFQCFKDSNDIPIHKMTIFIGENDSGKSTILKAIDIFLTNKLPNVDIFHRINDKMENSCEILIVFNNLHQDFETFPKEFVVNDQVTIKKMFTISEHAQIEQKIFVYRFIFENENLNDIPSLKSDTIKDIFHEFHLEYTKVEESKKQLQNYVNTHFDELPKKIDWGIINWSQISEFIPAFEYYNSSSMSSPTKQIENTLKSIYRSFFYYFDEETGQEKEINEFSEKRERIIEELNKKIETELKEKIQSNNKKIKKISGLFSIDFSSGFSLSSLQADFGQGERDINSIGEGSKKRLFLAITEWEKEIRSKQKFKKIIRAYDEPDTSLHYRAQKEMFFTFQSLSNQDTVKIQPILCTHSLTMIDRAPPRIINQVVINQGISHVEHLIREEDADIMNYLDNVSEISGLSNSSIFFERCFLIVEGETEEYTLPLIYKKIIGKSLSENGIILVNLETNNTWKSYLKLLSKNKESATILFLDNDIQEDPKKQITKQSVREVGFSDSFFDKNVILVGIKEFEDIFSNQLICNCLNSHYPKCEGEVWNIEDIARLREEIKFSKALQNIVGKYQNENGIRHCNFKKPDFGRQLGQKITVDEIRQIPVIMQLIEKIEQIIA
jgi:putative ATP-dependent endonuclease of OLD family